MTTEKDFIVALELGSSKIVGIAGRKNTDGSIDILAVEQEDSTCCIDKGVIYNMEKATSCIKHVIDNLRKDLQCEIKQVYVGTCFKSLHSEKNIVKRNLGEETQITDTMVDALLSDNESKLYNNMEILEVVAQEYRTGTRNSNEPVGEIASELEGHFLNILSQQQLKERVRLCFKEIGVQVADIYLLPLIMADNILTEQEERSGCAMVDFGAGTTTVSVYKNKILRHLAVIPLGGNSVTKDLCTLDIDTDEAEEIKLLYGNAYTDLSEIDGAQQRQVQLRDGRSILEKKVVDIIESRTEEIVANVANQIKKSGYNMLLLGGVIATGGYSNIKNMSTAITKATGINKIRLVRGLNSTTINTQPGMPQLNDARYCGVLSVLLNGDSNCYGGELINEDETGTIINIPNDVTINENTNESTNGLTSISEASNPETIDEDNDATKKEGEKKKGNSIFTKLGNSLKNIAKTFIEED